MSNILKDSFNSRINLLLKDESKLRGMQRNIRLYIDRNNEVLYDNGPNLRLFFNDDERNIIMDSINTTDAEITNILKKIDDINEKWTIAAPFNIASAMIIRGFEMKHNVEMTNLVIMYLSLNLYSSLQYKYFRFLPNKAAMDYTVNNMSNKYLIKKYAVMYKAIEHIAMKNHETYKKDLIRGEDLDIKNYIMNLRTRLNNFVQIIADEYLKVLSSKKYLNTEADNRDEENYVETTNISLKIEQLLIVCNNKFLSTNINPKFVRVAANHCTVHPPTLESALKLLKSNDTTNSLELMRRILKIYFSSKTNSFESLKTRAFVPYCLQIYSKSNVKDIDIIEMKKLLDEFLMKYCNRYTDTEREATRISYRKALYLYFLLHIQSCAMQVH